MDTRLSSRREDALVHAPSSLARSALVCRISCPPAPAGLLALSMWGEVQLSLECRGSMAWRPPARAPGRCVAPHGARGGWRLDEGGRQGAEGADREGGGRSRPRSRRAKGTHNPARAGYRDAGAPAHRARGPRWRSRGPVAARAPVPGPWRGARVDLRLGETARPAASLSMAWQRRGRPSRPPSPLCCGCARGGAASALATGAGRPWEAELCAVSSRRGGPWASELRAAAGKL